MSGSKTWSMVVHKGVRCASGLVQNRGQNQDINITSKIDLYFRSPLQIVLAVCWWLQLPKMKVSTDCMLVLCWLDVPSYAKCSKIFNDHPLPPPAEWQRQAAPKHQYCMLSKQQHIVTQHLKHNAQRRIPCQDWEAHTHSTRASGDNSSSSRHLLFFQATGIRQHGQDTSHMSFSMKSWCPNHSCASYSVLKARPSWFPHTICFDRKAEI